MSSQYVSGTMAQTMHQEYGEFIQIGSLRVRKALIQAYVVPDNWGKRNDGSLVYGLNVHFGSWASANCADEAETLQKVAELDWIFKKDYRSEGS